MVEGKISGGTVVFTDLIGLVTAPDQRLDVESINPGIEANGGKVSFELQRDGILLVNGAEWPFLDGKMTLLPTRMKLGMAEVRSYVLEVKGVSATRFVEKLELGNLAATGLFDGKLPLIFDQNGGRIEGGTLISRPPGGNLSYVGTLTYSDLSAMANFPDSSVARLPAHGGFTRRRPWRRNCHPCPVRRCSAGQRGEAELRDPPAWQSADTDERQCPGAVFRSDIQLPQHVRSFGSW